MDIPVASKPTERGWGKLVLAFLAFFLLPQIPPFRAFFPIEQPALLFIPALAACSLVGWWSGGRPVIAAIWVAVTVLVLATGMGNHPIGPFENLARAWCLLLAGAFGVISMITTDRPFVPRALGALTVTIGFALIVAVVGRVGFGSARETVAAELARRNSETAAAINDVVKNNPDEWRDLTTSMPQLADMPTDMPQELQETADAGLAGFPALLALESLAALALAWATYHRLARSRLGAPLPALKEFRFNDQLVWGLIIGVISLLLPPLANSHGVGRNLVIFFTTLYAMRGFGVLSFFLARGFLTAVFAIGLVLLLLPPALAEIGALAFTAMAVMALVLGLGDTWADWRRRPRSQ